MTNDGVHICIQPNDPFTLELKDSPSGLLAIVL
jgi:hypothetical protein